MVRLLMSERRLQGMRYFLLHVSTFVPLLAKVLIAPWGLKVAWLIYLFFTYVLLEHKEFNGHPVRAFANLQRQAECCMILGLVLSRWSPMLSALPFLLLTRARFVRVNELQYAFVFFLLYRFDMVQIVMVTLSIMSAILDVEKVVDTPDGWHRGCHRRLLFRGVQVLTLMLAYESLYVRVIIVLAFVFLKGVVWLYTPEDAPDAVVVKDGDPVNFLQGKSHRL